MPVFFWRHLACRQHFQQGRETDAYFLTFNLLVSLLVTLGFFDDIFIPYHYLQQNSEFNAEEQVWVWMYDENEMFMDLDEDIRFRVESEQFFDTSPSVRPKKEGVDTPDLSANSAKQAPYSLVVSFCFLFFFVRSTPPLGGEISWILSLTCACLLFLYLVVNHGCLVLYPRRWSWSTFMVGSIVEILHRIKKQI